MPHSTASIGRVTDRRTVNILTPSDVMIYLFWSSGGSRPKHGALLSLHRLLGGTGEPSVLLLATTPTISYRPTFEGM